MKVPETPLSVSELDLMKRLEAYAAGKETWQKDGAPLGPNAKKESRTLHTHIVQMVEKVLAPIMDRATARELDTFTMHDRVHGRKVAHLMWHILTTQRQLTLTPPEIGMLVLAAHLHDAGMALSREEREKRLAPESDLWDRAEASPTVKRNLKRLREMLTDPKLSDSKRVRVESELFQAEEALLALDTRERHALPERYKEIISQLCNFHLQDPTKIPDVEECFSFDGDSFKQKLIDICVSHNEDADVLVERDCEHFDRPRFPRDFPVGLALADTHLVAAALRLADILDFDRERTPATLFHYLVPSSLSHSVNISELEWGKHLTISNWEIEQTAVVFRGRCKNHIVHHAVVQFCGAIEEEIASTRATFSLGGSREWPFILPETVKAEIHAEGYSYLPYQFELDDGRVYELLMGRAIYDNPLVAVRELVQNAVDACSYRDALTKLVDPNSQPDTTSRITIRYEEPTDECEYPILRVIDTGTGMDDWLVERWFLKVGRSYYNSTEFARDRAQLRKGGVDFAPVSEFGIGFLSCFLLADRVDVETALWEPIRGDTRRRHLEIDGPTRLIRIREDPNSGLQRLRGTRVSLTLVRGGDSQTSETEVAMPWKEIREYIEAMCQDLPYRLNLEYVSAGVVASDKVERKPMTVALPSLYQSLAIRIPVDDEGAGLEGELAIVPYPAVRDAEKQKISVIRVSVGGANEEFSLRRSQSESVLLRGGFNVGSVPGIPESFGAVIRARVRVSWRRAENRRYPRTNLARTAVTDGRALSPKVREIWMRYLIRNRANLVDGTILTIQSPYSSDDLRQFEIGQPYKFEGPPRLDEWLDEFSALDIYELARNGWHFDNISLARRRQRKKNEKNIDPVAEWEAGNGSAMIDFDEMYGDLLLSVLPHVAPNLTVNRNGDVYVMAPLPEWREALRACHDFVSRPIYWPRFVTYGEGISEHLYYDADLSGFFNKKYADLLRGLGNEALDRVVQVLMGLLEARSDGAAPVLRPEDASLIRPFIESASNLEVGSITGSAKLGTFSLH